ncbi:hypothetical protein GCM10023347_25670 [Streptomyces chumphonensis]
MTLPEDLAEEIRRDVGPGGFSAYVSHAIRRQREQDRLGELVAFLETEHGPVTDAELAAAEAERRDSERFFVERQPQSGRDVPLAG